MPPSKVSRPAKFSKFVRNSKDLWGEGPPLETLSAFFKKGSASDDAIGATHGYQMSRAARNEPSASSVALKLWMVARPSSCTPNDSWGTPNGSGSNPN
mmetsp:Transcript_17624/g.48735  ORF Transcript_17624/g.48735 Transcript_17624/m.48735 type:complete len:98 (+) Transcript_17624:2-295(+)